MKKRIITLLLGLLCALPVAAQYRINIGGLNIRSGAAVPGSCSPNGSFFWKSSATQDWYKCINGTYSAFGSVSGSVTSVGLSTNASFLTVGSSPVTGAGTITLNLTSGLTANQVLATPDGTTGTVGLRALVAADIPALSAAKITSGTFTLAGPLFANQGTTTQVLHGNAAGNPSWSQIVNGDITNATIDLSTKVNASALARANGGLNSTSAGTGILRDGTTPTASELSGDAATSGSNAVTVNKVNGVSYSSSPATDTTAVVTAANATTYVAIPNCNSNCALTYNTSTHTFGSLTTTVTASLVSGRVPFANGTSSLTDSANLLYAAASGFTQTQGANAADTFLMKRATDTAPTGNFLRFQNAAASSNLFSVDVSGNVTSVSYATSNPSGNAGMLSLIQGTAPSNVANAVNLLAPTSVTTYALTYPGSIAAGLWRTNSSGTYSISELSGDATTSASNTVTVVKVNGVAYSASPSTDTTPIITAANTATYTAINNCGDSTHALSYNTSTHAFGCQAITATATAGGSNTQVQFNSSTALAGSANLTWVSPTLTVGLGGSATGIVAFGGATSGATNVTGPATGSGTNTLQAVTDTFVYRNSTDTLTNKSINASNNTITNLAGSMMTNNTVTATQLATQYSKGSCTEAWGGTGTSFALTSGDDAVANNSCYNDSGVTRTITAVKCRSNNGSNTTTVNPTFGSDGTGTTILSGAVTCGSSYAYSSSGTVSNASWTTGTGIRPVMGGTLTGTSISMIVEYTF